jgi:hypothetical protein
LAAEWAAQAVGRGLLVGRLALNVSAPRATGRAAASFAINEGTCETVAMAEIAILFEMEKET